MKTQLPNLKIYKVEGYEGYDSNDLQKWLGERNLLYKWGNFANGQTGAIVDGHYIYFKNDVLRFLQSKENID